MPPLLHAKRELLKKTRYEIGCRLGAVPKDGMENTEITDVLTPIYGDDIDAIAHI
mgnify:CR=1 FL=1